MKKRFVLILLAILLLSGCGPLQEKTEKKQIVETIFPLYDFAREIAGEDAEVKMLLKPGAEVHSYEPTPQDIIAIQNCDVFLYIGGESDEWVRNVLSSVDTSRMQGIDADGLCGCSRGSRKRLCMERGRMAMIMITTGMTMVTQSMTSISGPPRRMPY